MLKKEGVEIEWSILLSKGISLHPLNYKSASLNVMDTDRGEIPRLLLRKESV
jgi:hypothetical protein